jgi:membrane-associated HD superfamily phosphohydrolase
MVREAPSGRRRSSSTAEIPQAPARRLGLGGAFWAAAYVLATTFSFAPTPSFRRAPLTAGSIAPRDVVAPRDVIVADAAATARRRGETAAEVMPVYDWEPSAPARLEAQLRHSFGKAREAAARSRRLVPVPASVRDAFDLPIGEEALSALARQSFSPELEDRLIGAATALYHAGVVDNRELLLESRPRGIVARDTVSGRETRRKDFADVVEYGAAVRNALAERLGNGPLSGRALSEVAAFLASAIRPNLTFNATETARRRQDAARSVETVLTRIPRGKVVVRRGDEISPRAAEIIAAVRAPASDVSAWVRVAGVLLLQLLAALAFWVDSRRQRRRRRERRAEIVYASVLATGIVFSLVTRGAFALAQTLSSSFEGSSWAAHTYFAIPFAAGAIMVSLVAGMGPALLFAAVQAVGATGPRRSAPVASGRRCSRRTSI